MKKLAFAAAIALCGVFSTHAMAAETKPIYAIDKDSMKSFCKNSEGQYYDTEGGGYGCHAQGGKTTKECGKDGKCVHISWDELVVPTSPRSRSPCRPAGCCANPARACRATIRRRPARRQRRRPDAFSKARPNTDPAARGQPNFRLALLMHAPEARGAIYFLDIRCDTIRGAVFVNGLLASGPRPIVVHYDKTTGRHLAIKIG